MKLPDLPNFIVDQTTPLGIACQSHELPDFHAAIQFIRQLPYGRNSRKDQLELLFEENCGTCSTKHAFLAQLAIEHHQTEIELIMGIYQMNADNTPGIGAILEQNQLAYIPEAHNYLRYQGQRYDLTNLATMAASPFDVLMEELTITPIQIAEFKPQYHRSFLQKWIDQEQIPHSLTTIWNIREACIKALQALPSAN